MGNRCDCLASLLMLFCIARSAVWSAVSSSYRTFVRSSGLLLSRLWASHSTIVKHTKERTGATMSFILEGTINGMRPVGGKVEKGKNAGSYWHFLSMEVCDSRFGQVYSCQVRTSEKDLFTKFVKVGPGKDKDGNNLEVGSLVQDVTGHKV